MGSGVGFYDRIKNEVRLRKNMSIEDWLDNVFHGELTRDSYNGLRRRGLYPRLDICIEMARDLGTSVEYLFTGADSVLSDIDRVLLSSAKGNRLILEYLETMDPADRENVLEIARLYADKAKAARERQSEIAAEEQVAYGLPSDRPGPGERGYVRYKKRDDDPNFQKPGDVRYKRREVKEGENPDDRDSVI